MKCKAKCKVTKITSTGVSQEEFLTSDPFMALMIAAATNERKDAFITVEGEHEEENEE